MTAVALALGGGGARGIAHIHVLEAFDDLGVKPVAIAGSSIGSMMGAGYAAGMSGRDVREYAVATLSRASEIASRLWGVRAGGLRDLFGSGGPRIGEFDIHAVMKAFLPEAVPATFGELEIPLKVVVADFYAIEQRVIDAGDLTSALAASAAIPVLFHPQVIDERVMVDGGLINPVPFDVVADEADVVVAVDVVGAPTGANPAIPKRVELAFGTMQMLMQTITNLKLETYQPDLLIRPAVSEYRVLEFHKVEEILRTTEATRNETKRRLERLLEAL